MKNNPAFPCRGFTLIELLTVIAIIGILAAIIIPTVGKVRETAKTATCASNIRQVGMALRLCAEDRKGRLPLPFNNIVGAEKFTWHQMVESYLPPRDKNSWYKGQNAVMVCPGIKWDGVSAADAGACYSLAGAAVGINNDTSIERVLSSIISPSLSPWLLDGAQASTSSTGVYYAKYWMRNSEVISDVVANTNTYADFRHSDSVNTCMADGSVKRIKRNEWTTKFPSIGPGSKRWSGQE